MKNRFLFKSSLLIVAFLTITTSLVSCTMEENANAKKTSISSFVQSQSNLSTLEIALERTGLYTTLDSQGTYTLFAPSNDAFDAFLVQSGFKSIDQVPTQTLREILLNHVIGQTLNTTDLPGSGYIKTLAKGNVSTTNTLSMYVNKTSGIFLNNVAKVTTGDVLANNGIVHIVNGVIGFATVTDQIKANPNLSSLLGVLSGAGQPAFLNTFSGTGPFTVFAPVNNAFTSLNSELTGGIASVSSANLTKILQYHVVADNILSTSLTDGQVVSSLLAPQTFTVSLTNGPRLKDVNNRNSNIITTDIQCSNGVIHILSKVLLPTL